MSLVFIALCVFAHEETLCRELAPISVVSEVEECRAELPALEALIRFNIYQLGKVVTSFDAFCESGAEG